MNDKPEKNRYLTVGDGAEAFRKVLEHIDLSGLTVYVLGAGTGFELEALAQLPEARRPKQVIAYELNTEGMPDYIRGQCSSVPGQKWITLHEGAEAGNFATRLVEDPGHAMKDNSAIIGNPPYALLGKMRKAIINPAGDKIKGTLLITSISEAAEHYADHDVIARLPAGTSFDPPPKEKFDHFVIMKGFEGRVDKVQWKDVLPESAAIHEGRWKDSPPPVEFLSGGGMRVTGADRPTLRRLAKTLGRGYFNGEALDGASAAIG